MSWRKELTAIRDILKDLYPVQQSASRVVQDADIPLHQVAVSAKAVDNWHAILEEAHKHGKVLALVDVALHEYPNHNDLRAARRAYHAAFPGQGGSSQTKTASESTAQPSVDREIPTLRQRIYDSFDDQELRNLCFDHFREVYKQFAAGMAFDDMVRRLVDFARRKRQGERLLDLLEQTNSGIIGDDRDALLAQLYGTR